MKLLTDLRSLAPPRRLTPLEAYGIAERQATRLLWRAGVNGAPVPSEVIAELPFVQVALRQLPPGTAGASDWVKPRWLILLNAYEPAVRQRFSLAHEFKHIIDSPRLPKAALGRMSRTQYETNERLCDYFAACLLMPRPWIKAAWVSGEQDVVRLARLFEVSPQAMYIRLSQLGLLEPMPRHSGIDNMFLRSAPALPLGLAA